mmetsp:Transcript_14729/g.32541  ORF Transcript_14729/g.32541 Transcript_14729/m.32541 type:complete len:218 (-) Transcript_14729:50-703(-)
MGKGDHAGDDHHRRTHRHDPTDQVAIAVHFTEELRHQAIFSQGGHEPRLCHETNQYHDGKGGHLSRCRDVPRPTQTHLAQRVGKAAGVGHVRVRNHSDQNKRRGVVKGLDGRQRGPRHIFGRPPAATRGTRRGPRGDGRRNRITRRCPNRSFRRSRWWKDRRGKGGGKWNLRESFRGAHCCCRVALRWLRAAVGDGRKISVCAKTNLCRPTNSGEPS